MFDHNNTAKLYDLIKLKEIVVLSMEVPVQYPANPFLVAGHKESSVYGVKFAIKGLRRSLKVS